MARTANLTLQQWGNSLAVRIPAAVARSARFQVGQLVEVSAPDSRVLVKALGEPRLSLPRSRSRAPMNRLRRVALADASW